MNIQIDDIKSFFQNIWTWIVSQFEICKSWFMKQSQQTQILVGVAAFFFVMIICLRRRIKKNRKKKAERSSFLMDTERVKIKQKYVENAKEAAQKQYETICNKIAANCKGISVCLTSFIGPYSVVLSKSDYIGIHQKEFIQLQNEACVYWCRTYYTELSDGAHYRGYVKGLLWDAFEKELRRLCDNDGITLGTIYYYHSGRKCLLTDKEDSGSLEKPQGPFVDVEYRRYSGLSELYKNKNENG